MGEGEADLARLRLIRSPRIGPVTYRQLIARFGSAAAGGCQADREGDRQADRPADVGAGRRVGGAVDRGRGANRSNDDRRRRHGGDAQ